MASVNLKDARRRLSGLVRAAERGQPVVLTRRGRSVARIEPLGGHAAKRLPDLTGFRASLATKGKPLSEVVIAARREGRF
jgi:prevent-host-death family protein